MAKRLITIFLQTLALLLFLTACQNDQADGPQGGETAAQGDKVKISFRITTAGNQKQTRADWRDDNTNDRDEEMMHVWTVIMVDNATDKIVEILSCKPTYNGISTDDNDREWDQVFEKELPAGNTYRFYSFANIGASKLEELLVLPASSVPVPATSDVVASSVPASDTFLYQSGSNNIPQTGDGTIVDNVIVSLGANGKTYNDLTATEDPFGFGSKGIPMSNVQTYTVPSTSETKDLIVIRMFAKIEVQVYNDGDNSATIHSVSLTDVTPNVSNNLKLLPRLTLGANTMDYVHKDIQPNLGTTSKGNVTCTFTSENVVAATGHKSTDATPSPVKFTFYVNESAAPGNGSGLFYLTLGIKTGSGEDVVYSHALINQSGKTEADDDAWHYIARNDYRIIPVILTDWEFRIEPIAFVPIGGYPAVLLSSDAQKATFSTGGMIALQPFVKKRTETTWRDFDNSEVNPGVGDSWNESITWKNDNGSKVSGTDNNIIKTPFTYDPVTKYIIGELNNGLSKSEKTAVTITVKLGTDPQYTYSFTCDVNLQK